MRSLTVYFNWKKMIWTSIVVLVALMGLSFYGIYTNKFYFLKPDNYIIPILGVVHLLYLYVVRFKISEDELPDPKMRNLEYVVYGLVAVYVFKIYDSAMTLGSVAEFGEHVIPPTFRPMGILILVLYSLLTLSTLHIFWLRKKYVGAYKFENYNSNLNIWQ